MLEFLRIFGIFMAVASFALAVFVFFRLNVPSAIAYFTGNANKRLKEYQQMQKNYLNGSKPLSKVKTDDSTGTLTNTEIGTDTATLTNVDDTATMTGTDGEFANALYYAQSTTTLLEEN